MRWLLKIAFLCCGLFYGGSNCLAVLPDEILTDRTLEMRARALSSGLRCLVCQNETIDESLAPLARDLRLFIRERLLAGDNDEQILSFITARYGEFILLRPPFNAKTALLWLFPPIILSVASGIIFFRIRQRKINRQTSTIL